MKLIAKTIILLAVMTVFTAATGKSPKIVKTVEVSGTTFEVIIKEGEARVSPRKIYFAKKLNVEYFKNARLAAETASGCIAGADRAFRHVVIVELICSRTALGE